MAMNTVATRRCKTRSLSTPRISHAARRISNPSNRDSGIFRSRWNGRPFILLASRFHRFIEKFAHGDRVKTKSTFPESQQSIITRGVSPGSGAPAIPQAAIKTRGALEIRLKIDLERDIAHICAHGEANNGTWWRGRNCAHTKRHFSCCKNPAWPSPCSALLHRNRGATQWTREHTWPCIPRDMARTDQSTSS